MTDRLTPRPDGRGFLFSAQDVVPAQLRQLATAAVRAERDTVPAGDRSDPAAAEVPWRSEIRRQGEQQNVILAAAERQRQRIGGDRLTKDHEAIGERQGAGIDL